MPIVMNGFARTQLPSDYQCDMCNPELGQVCWLAVQKVTIQSTVCEQCDSSPRLLRFLHTRPEPMKRIYIIAICILLIMVVFMLGLIVLMAQTTGL